MENLISHWIFKKNYFSNVMFRKIKLAEKFFWLIVTLPLYVKPQPITALPLVMQLINWFIFSSFGFFLLGLALHPLGVDKQNWASEIITNPYIVFNAWLAYSCLALAGYYIYMIVTDGLDIKEMKKWLLEDEKKSIH